MEQQHQHQLGACQKQRILSPTSRPTAFSYCPWGSPGKNAEVVCHSLLQWTNILSELSTMTHPSWVALHGMAHELDKAVIHVMTED